MKKIIILLIAVAIVGFSTTQGFALSQTERIDQVRTLLADVDGRSAQEIIKDLNTTKSPEGQLQILEAIAQTYRDMVVEYDVTVQARKDWLHSMILLNVAFYQFGGMDDDQNETMLNVAIRRKLKSYFSAQLMESSGLFYSLED